MESLLRGWESYYVIVGSSAAALTGLMFVVMTLISDSDVPGSSRTIAAFGTPNIVHFCASLLVSATLSAPWPSLHPASVAIAVYGVAGVIYTSLVTHHAKTQEDYKPVFEDWLWHSILPLASYITLTAAAIEMTRAPVPALFACAIAPLVLVFIGIHNAWDTVTYLAMQRRQGKDGPPQGGPYDGI